MAIPELEHERVARALDRFCDKVPVEIRRDLTRDYRFVRSEVVLLEGRPHFQDRDRQVEHLVAKFRYNAKRGCWTLLWPDRNLRWHTYDGFEEKRRFEDLLREVERDPTGIFFG